MVIHVCVCISCSSDASVPSDIWLCTPTSPRRLTSLNLGKGRCIGWRRSVKMGGSKAHLWEQLLLVSSRETTWPLCPGQWGAAGAVEDALSSSVCAQASSRGFPFPGSSLNTVAAIYSLNFFHADCVSLRNKASRSSGVRRQRAKTVTLVAARNCGRSLCSTWHKEMPQKKKKKEHFERAKFVNALFPCAIMPCSAASLHSLPSFVGIAAFTSSHWKVQNYLVTPEAHS